MKLAANNASSSAEASEPSIISDTVLDVTLGGRLTTWAGSVDGVHASEERRALLQAGERGLTASNGTRHQGVSPGLKLCPPKVLLHRPNPSAVTGEHNSR